MRTKPTLVLMAGLPCAGKTTIARALGRDLGWNVIDKDRRKEDLLKKGGDDKKAGREAYNWSFEAARSILTKDEEQVSVILDSAALHLFIIDNALGIVSSVEN